MINHTTSNSSIFTVATVVDSKRIGRTVNESGLTATTLDVIQPYLSSTIRNCSPREGNTTYRETSIIIRQNNINVVHCGVSQLWVHAVMRCHETTCLAKYCFTCMHVCWWNYISSTHTHTHLLHSNLGKLISKKVSSKNLSKPPRYRTRYLLFAKWAHYSTDTGPYLEKIVWGGKTYV